MVDRKRWDCIVKKKKKEAVHQQYQSKKKKKRQEREPTGDRSNAHKTGDQLHEEEMAVNNEREQLH